MIDVILDRGGVLYSVKPYPPQLAGAKVFRWAIYRDSFLCGATRTKKEALRRIGSGEYDHEREMHRDEEE